MKIHFIRHATLQIELAGCQLLVDPMLAAASAYRSLTWGSSAARNPLVPLPCPVNDLLRPDIIIATHEHFDHFDAAAVCAAAPYAKVIVVPMEAINDCRLKRSAIVKAAVLLPADGATIELPDTKRL